MMALHARGFNMGLFSTRLDRLACAAEVAGMEVAQFKFDLAKAQILRLDGRSAVAALTLAADPGKAAWDPKLGCWRARRGQSEV